MNLDARTQPSDVLQRWAALNPLEGAFPTALRHDAREELKRRGEGPGIYDNEVKLGELASYAFDLVEKVAGLAVQLGDRGLRDRLYEERHVALEAETGVSIPRNAQGWRELRLLALGWDGATEERERDPEAVVWLVRRVADIGAPLIDRVLSEARERLALLEAQATRLSMLAEETKDPDLRAVAADLTERARAKRAGIAAHMTGRGLRSQAEKHIARIS